VKALNPFSSLIFLSLYRLLSVSTLPKSRF